MAAILKTFAGLNFYTRTCFIDYYHISFKKSHQTVRPRSCRVNQNFDISWILDLGLYIIPIYNFIVLFNFRHYTRLVVLKMMELRHPKRTGDAVRLETAARNASAALPVVLKCLNDIRIEEVHEETNKIRELIAADLRVIQGLSVPLVAARKVEICFHY